jgi:carboxyl-terminal processing protease
MVTAQVGRPPAGFPYRASTPVFLALLLPLPLAAQTNLRPYDEVVAAVRQQFYDRSYHGLDWDRRAEALRPRARACETPAELHALINRELLAPLRASHTVLIEGDVYRDHYESEFLGKASRRAGLELGRFDNGYFVTAVVDGGPAARAAIDVGDRVVAVNGLPPEASLRVADAGSDPGLPGEPHAVLRVDPTLALELRIQSAPEGPTRRVRLWADDVSLIEATRSGARIVERNGMKLAVLHPWHLMNWGMVRTMKEALEGPLAGADGLVLDLRGRGGQIHVLWGALALFTPRRDGTRPWPRPAVALIDGSARSAKEIFAWHWRRMGIGPLVGQRTAGAVLGSAFVRIGGGFMLQLPVTDVSRLTDGVRLEGVGVEPDVPVAWSLPWSRGHDAILEKGLEVLAGEIRKGAGPDRFY